MKILLLFPPITINVGSVKKCNLPIGLAYIAAYLEKQGHDVHVIDISVEGYEREEVQGKKMTFGLAKEEVQRKIKEINPELIGITCSFSSQFHNVINLSAWIKEIGDYPVAVGGQHPTIDVKNVLRNVRGIDYIIMGEGEVTSHELALALSEGKNLDEIDGLAFRKEDQIIINQPRKPIMNIDELPWPARHLFNMEKYTKINKPFNHFPKKERVLSMVTSRGCPGKCNFCSSPIFWKFARYRDPDDVVAEMKMLIEK